MPTEWVFDLNVQYKQVADLNVTTDFSYNLGKLPLYWFRVEGLCITPTAPSGTCAPGSPVAGTGSCPQKFIQVVPATGPDDVCQKLANVGFIWQINRISKFSIPVSPAEVAKQVAAGTLDPKCNTLTDVPFSQVLPCKQFSLAADVTTAMGMGMTVLMVSFMSPKPKLAPKKVTSCRISATGKINSRTGGIWASPHKVFGFSTYTISPGGISSAEVFGSVAITPNLNPPGIPAGVVGSPVVSVPNQFISSWGGFATCVSMVPVFNGIPAPTIIPLAEIVSNDCGCLNMPSRLELSHTLSRALPLNNFLLRNGLSLPSVLPMAFSNINQSYQSQVHLQGISNDGVTIEVWNVLFDWTCTNIFGGMDIGSSMWRFSMSVNRRNKTTQSFAETRFVVGFPPLTICADENQLGALNFGFQVNVQTLAFITKHNLPVDIKVLYDNLGLFASQDWFTNPYFSINISGVENPVVTPRQDIRPIFPGPVSIGPVAANALQYS